MYNGVWTLLRPAKEGTDMPQTRIFAAAAVLGLAAILVLGTLAALEPRMRELRGAASATAAYRAWTLSDDNLADAVGGLQLHHRITRVAWDHNILSVDLLLREGETGGAALWADVAALIRFSFADAGNVRRTLIRVYGGPEGRRTLLFYGDPGREDWPADRLAALRPPADGAEAAFRERASLKATPAGERWLRNFAN
jgi:hypothetical protein